MHVLEAQVAVIHQQFAFLEGGERKRLAPGLYERLKRDRRGVLHWGNGVSARNKRAPPGRRSRLCLPGAAVILGRSVARGGMTG